MYEKKNHAIILIILELYNPTDTSAAYKALLCQIWAKAKMNFGTWIYWKYYVAHFGLGMTWNVEYLTCSDSFSPPLKYLSEFGDKNTFHHSLEFL